LRLYLAYNQSYGSLKFCQNFPIGAIINFSIFRIKQLNFKIIFSHPQKALPCAEPRHMSY